jgi:hypothetical protein
MEDFVEGPMLTLKTLDRSPLDVVGKNIECRAGNMIVDPVDRTSIAHTWVSL